MRNNTWVVLQREYLTRVKKKSFWLSTILMPLLMVALIFVPSLILMFGGSEKNIALVDETGLYIDAFKDGKNRFEAVADTSTATQALREGEYDAILYIPQGSLDSNRQAMLLFYAKSEPSMETVKDIESATRDKLRMNLMSDDLQIDPVLFDYINRAEVDLQTRNIETGARSYTEVKSLFAYISGFLIYMFIFLFGNQIMSGVIEEKSSRIIEVMVSSVKPFQLLSGKVLGLALVGLTQLLLWGVLTLVLTLVVGIIGGGAAMDAAQVAASSGAPDMMASADRNQIQQTMANVQDVLSSLNLKAMLGYFLIYFLGGYLLYASLFAAVGSAVENQEDTNQFMWPITIPLLLGIIVITTVLKDPYSQIAVWTSIIPFTSPIVMLARIPFGVPAWELGLSLALLVLSFIGTTWLAARIYRVGILMYGKKGSYKELWRWLKYKG